MFMTPFRPIFSVAFFLMACTPAMADVFTETFDNGSP